MRDGSQATPETRLDSLPVNIGAPARRALAAAGITTLEQLPAHSAKELLALHGVGPRATRLLGEQLAGRGLAFREDRTTELARGGA